VRGAIGAPGPTGPQGPTGATGATGPAAPAVPEDLSITTLRLTSTTDVSTSSTGHAFQVGPSDGANLRIDANEIQTLDDGAATTGLFLQLDGGPVGIGLFGDSATTLHTFYGLYSKPNLPAFQATGTSTQTASGAAASDKIVLATALVNRGSHYSTANSRFTAPAAGLYSFSFSTTQNTTVLGPEIEIFVNGVIEYNNVAIGYTTANRTFGGSWVLDLAANDYVEVFLTNNNGVTTTIDRARTWFAGFFLG
jgi:hypothetical protein